MADYVHVGDIIEQERLRRQVQIAKGVNPDVVDHIEKAVQNDSFQSDMESNLSRFADDISGFDKAETEFLLSKLQRQLNADSGSVLLKSMRTIALQHMNDIEKADEGRAVGETKQINGKTYVWTEYAPGKFDWHISEKRGKQEQPQGNKQAKTPEAPNSPQGNQLADVSSHAKEASTDALKRAAADKNAAPEVRQAAKQELESRGGSGRMVDSEFRLDKNNPDAKRFLELDKRWDDKETRKKMSEEELEEYYSLAKKRRSDIDAIMNERDEERRKQGKPVIGDKKQELESRGGESNEKEQQRIRDFEDDGYAIGEQIRKRREESKARHQKDVERRKKKKEEGIGSNSAKKVTRLMASYPSFTYKIESLIVKHLGEELKDKYGSDDFGDILDAVGEENYDHWITKTIRRLPKEEVQSLYEKYSKFQ